MARADRGARNILVAILVVACGAGACTTSTTPPGHRQLPGHSAQPASSSAVHSAAPVNPASVHANELGLVPVLMYHQLVAHPVGDYEITPTAFRAEVETLAREDYVPITARDLVTRRIDIPAGKHPVVLTFDDATVGQLRLGSDGQPQPGTAVAILEQVAREHPGFAPVATFYVNKQPFAGQAGALRWLVDHGFEVADHTFDHTDLSTVSATAAQKELVEGMHVITDAVPGYSVATMALPYGSSPRNAHVAVHGSWHGTAYSFAGVFLVGAGPAPSPFARTWDPARIPRIRSEATQRAPRSDRHYVSGYYLPWLQRHPSLRYTSDGDPGRVSFPRTEAGQLAPAFRSQANGY